MVATLPRFAGPCGIARRPLGEGGESKISKVRCLPRGRSALLGRPGER